MHAPTSPPKLYVTSVSVSVSVQLQPIVSGIGRQHGIGLTLPLNFTQDAVLPHNIEITLLLSHFILCFHTECTVDKYHTIDITVYYILML